MRKLRARVWGDEPSPLESERLGGTVGANEPASSGSLICGIAGAEVTAVPSDVACSSGGDSALNSRAKLSSAELDLVSVAGGSFSVRFGAYSRLIVSGSVFSSSVSAF